MARPLRLLLGAFRPWIVACGAASSSWAATVYGGTDEVEGLAGYYFGGTDDTDNSGTLSYVRVWRNGAMNATNGITFAGVGSGTASTTSKSLSLDDGVFVGGTVNVKYLSVLFVGDDAVDTDLGYQGKIQFAFVLVGGAATTAPRWTQSTRLSAQLPADVQRAFVSQRSTSDTVSTRDPQGLGHYPSVSWSESAEECTAIGRRMCSSAELCPGGVAYDAGYSGSGVGGGQRRFGRVAAVRRTCPSLCVLHSVTYSPDPHPCFTHPDPTDT